MLRLTLSLVLDRNAVATEMGSPHATQLFAVAHETVAVPVPFDAHVLFFSLNVPSALFSVTFPPATGHDTITLTVAVPAATVLFEAGSSATQPSGWQCWRSLNHPW